ncbi:MAG: hypothetical protein PVF75_10210, partial [Granulosicoccaceae bacterium]
AVHPLRESAVRDLLGRAGQDWSVVEKMIAEGALKEVNYLGKRYLVRRFVAHHEERLSRG